MRDTHPRRPSAPNPEKCRFADSGEFQEIKRLRREVFADLQATARGTWRRSVQNRLSNKVGPVGIEATTHGLSERDAEIDKVFELSSIDR